MERPIRILIAKIGLDGHDRGAKVVATALKNAGMEVIYTGLRHTAEQVVEAAIQEDVDAIGVSILSGAHITVFTDIMNLLKQHECTDIIVTGGGIIPQEDINILHDLGVEKIFTPGTDTHDIINYLQLEVPKRRNF
ncbi:MAG: cobalamin B12-binding domain-containing protein [Alphaproteobacteria bacterium]|nr:cobalamin B12-binding domain-containing protein [Alphaproteobacteria bacterium]